MLVLASLGQLRVRFKAENDAVKTAKADSVSEETEVPGTKSPAQVVVAYEEALRNALVGKDGQIAASPEQTIKDAMAAAAAATLPAAKPEPPAKHRRVGEVDVRMEEAGDGNEAAEASKAGEKNEGD